MGSDSTRFSFNPIKGFSGLHKQQGRVSLDSDSTEFEEILDRRARATTYDIVGQAVTPATTPNGFLIGGTLAAPTIGVGRAYVDGILAECFGDLTTTDRDDVLGRVRGSAPIAYGAQPFFYAPGFPALPAAVGDIVYLDVWQREVTVFEDDGLREVALNGPDTATRVQTAWQVKILHGAGATGCPTPLPSSITAPSTARLTAQATPAAPAAGPCVINPAGGYTGLENRLYRVEIHRAGTLGGVGPARAQFKWSRDNASLAARVLSITGVSPTESIITVSSTGRDAWMRFEHNDHIELLDDFVEYAMRETGTGGPMARILTVNHATGEIHVDQDLTAFAVVATRHPRIRRWDILNPAEALVRDVNNGTAIPLEQGITVTFGGSSGDTLHAGDYWVFAARTADGTIEMLTNEPPRGVLHHFYKLAVATGGTPPFTDCREPWPPPTGGDSCCTVIVRPGQSIQAAIDSLPPAGGCVCLKVGIHTIAATIQVNRSNVHLHGESAGAEIHSPGLGETIHIGGTVSAIHDVMVESLRIVVDASASAFGIVIGVDSANRVAVRDVEAEITSPAVLPPPYVGVVVDNSNDVVFVNNTVANVFYGAIVEDVGERMWLCDNTFAGPVYSVAAFSGSFGAIGVWLGSESAGDHRVERNLIRDFWTGVDVSAGSTGATVISNRILRLGGPVTGPVPTTAAELRKYLDDRSYAIELSGGLCTARANRIELLSAQWGGIRIRTERANVSDNVLDAELPGTETLVPASIYCTVDATSGRTGSTSTVRGNSLHGPQTGIVISRVAGVEVCDNRMDGTFRGWFGARVDDSSYATVAGNLVFAVGFGFSMSEGDHNIVRDNRLSLALIGVLSDAETDLDVRGNEVTGGVLGGLVLNVASGALTVTHNRIVNCGWIPVASGIQGGIFAISGEIFGFAGAGQLRIESCEVIDSGIAPDGKLAAGAVRGIHAWVPSCQILSNRVVCVDERLRGVPVEHRALLLLGPLSYINAVNLTGAAVVANNVFRGPGRTALVQFFLTAISDPLGYWFQKIAFNGNFCDHLTTPVENGATVLLAGRHVAVSANQVTAPRGMRSMDGAGSLRASVVGNVTTGSLVNFPTVLPMPIPDFNIQV